MFNLDNVVDPDCFHPPTNGKDDAQCRIWLTALSVLLGAVHYQDVINVPAKQ